MTEQAAQYEAIENPDKQWAIAPLEIEELTMANIELMKKQADEFQIGPNGENYPKVRDAHIQAKGLDLKIRKRVDDLNNSLKAEIKTNREAGDKLQSLVSPIIETLFTKRTAWEKIEADRKATREKAETERLAKIKGLMDRIADLPATVTGMFDSDGILRIAEETRIKEILFDDYMEFTEEAKKVRDRSYLTLLAMYENLKKAEQEAREAELKRLVQEAEARRLDEERKALDEKNRIEREALEAERKLFEAEKTELERIKQVAEVARQAELDKIEAEAKAKKRAEEDALLKAALEETKRKRAEEAEARAEIESRERAEREAAEKIAAEQAEIIRLAEVERLRPDREKIRIWASELLKISPPQDLSDFRLMDMVQKAIEKIHNTATIILDIVEHD